MAYRNQTVESYERFAATYNTLVGPTPPERLAAALRAFADLAGTTGSVLEIGSGPGRDADFLESLGVRVRRTDATRAFLDLQARRGRTGELLDVITDDLGGPYDGVLALCVLIHVPFEWTDAVLAKIAHALRPGGAFLVSLREGDGETFGAYHTVYWRDAGFGPRLRAAGLHVEWQDQSVDSDGDSWLTYLARRVG